MEPTGNPVIDQREAALRAVWAEAVRLCAGGVESSRYVEIQDHLIDRLREAGFKTKAMGMRGAARYVQDMMRRATQETAHV
jgi:hypothetical protein